MVWDREGCLHAGRGRPTDAYAGFCGGLKLDWYFCQPADPQAKGAVERLQGYMESNFEPGRHFANHLDFQLQLDAWFEKANARTHKTLRARPIDRLAEELQVMRALPEREPDLDRRWVTRVPPDPHVRVDTSDDSLDPRLVGRRVEVRVSQRQVTAVALDTGELACLHERSFAKNRTITALEHARVLKERHGEARKTLEEFDFAFQRSIKKQVIEHLGQLDFLHAKENVILLGPPGTGKTHLAIALAIRACLAGQRVLFRTATEWVALLADAQRQGRLQEELRRLERYPLLVCDEIGYIPFDPQAANLMFMLVSRRYERASLILTSNKPFLRVGRDLRRRRRRRRDGRPARPLRRNPLPQERQLPPQGPRPRTPPPPSNPPTDPPNDAPATTRSTSPTARLHEQPPQGRQISAGATGSNLSRLDTAASSCWLLCPHFDLRHIRGHTPDPTPVAPAFVTPLFRPAFGGFDRASSTVVK